MRDLTHLSLELEDLELEILQNQLLLGLEALKGRHRALYGNGQGLDVTRALSDEGRKSALDETGEEI